MDCMFQCGLKHSCDEYTVLSSSLPCRVEEVPDRGNMATLAKGGRPAVNSIPFRLHLCPFILFLHLQTSGSSDRVRRWILNMLVSARHRSLNMVSDLTIPKRPDTITLHLMKTQRLEDSFVYNHRSSRELLNPSSPPRGSRPCLSMRSKPDIL
jgi:hypothetical protein